MLAATAAVLAVPRESGQKSVFPLFREGADLPAIRSVDAEPHDAFCQGRQRSGLCGIHRFRTLSTHTALDRVDRRDPDIQRVTAYLNTLLP